MICRHCGKECPEDTKFCIFCGGLLEDPDKEFMGNKFDTVEECAKAKQDYAALTNPFTPADGEYSLGDLRKAIEVCQNDQSYHPVAARLALEYLNPIAEKLEYTVKRNNKRSTVRVFSSLYAVFVIAVLVLQPITRIGEYSNTYLGMIALAIPGQLGLFTWIWNIAVVLGVLLSVACSISFIKNPDIDLNVAAPFLVSFFLIVIWVVNIIPQIFGLEYNFLSAFWWIVIGGIIVGTINLAILPKKMRKEQ